MVDESIYADKIISDSQGSHNDYYFISKTEIVKNSIFYRANRAGIAQQLPKIFEVERSEKTPYCQLFCVLSGKGKLEYRGNVFMLNQGDLGLLSSFEKHKYKCNPNEPMGQIWLEFYGANAYELVQTIVNANGPILKGLIFGKVVNLLGTIISLLEADEGHNISVEIYKILFEILKNHEESNEIRQQDIKLNLAYIQTYIQTNLHQNMNNDFLAELCYISCSYFTKSFKKAFRITPQKYIANQRIIKAQYLLAETNESIVAIAEQLGYCFAFY